jgi:hypothetical protein
MANYQTYSSIQNGLFSESAFEQSNLDKKQVIELEEEINTLQIEIETTEEEISQLNSEIEMKQGEIATAERIKADSETEAIFEENKMTEELSEAALAETEAEEASANAAEEMVEGEEAELSETILFWIPGLDVADEILAGVLFAEAATATALALEKQSTASTLTTEAAVDEELMTTSLTEVETEEGIIDEKEKEMTEIRIQIGELEEEIETTEIRSKDLAAEREVMQVQATAQEKKGKEDMEESWRHLSKSFIYRVEGMVMEIFCLLSLTVVAGKGLVQQLIRLLWKEEEEQKGDGLEQGSGDWKNSFYHSLYYGVALGLVWSFLTRDYLAPPSSSRILSTSPSSIASSPLAYLTSLSPHLVAQLQQALLAIGFGVVFSLLLTLLAHLARRSSFYQRSLAPLLSSDSSLGIVSFVSWKYFSFIELLFLLLLTVREWSLYAIPLLPGGWFALSQLCSPAANSQPPSSSSRLLFTCPPHDLSLTTLLSHSALFLGIFLFILLFVSALSLAIRFADRQQLPSASSPHGDHEHKYTTIADSPPSEWTLCGAINGHRLPGIALHLLVTFIVLLLYFPTLQLIYSHLSSWQAQSVQKEINSLSLSALIQSLLVTSLTSATRISLFVSVLHFALSTLVLGSVSMNRIPLTLRLNGILMAATMCLQTFFFGLFLILLVVSSISLSLLPALPSSGDAPPSPTSSSSSPVDILAHVCYLLAIILTILSVALTLNCPHLSLADWHRQIIKEVEIINGSHTTSPRTYQGHDISPPVV